MGILVYRDHSRGRDLVGRIETDFASTPSFTYDAKYLERAISAGEFGISELLPLSNEPYSPQDFSPFFQGLLPEGEVLENLSKLYQVPANDYLTLLEQLGCESIGALTFVSERIDPKEYTPHFEHVDPQMVEEMIAHPARMATLAASSTRLSLSGAQSKVAWFLPAHHDETAATIDDWLIPRGTAASTHIIKISRNGEEDIAVNELACSLLAKSCGIETAEVFELPDIPGAIAVKRYDRIVTPSSEASGALRLHQEDFCQALGLPPHLKYQPQHVTANYPAMASDLIQRMSCQPAKDNLEFAKRLIFCYAVGNSDAHLKNFSCIYDREWKKRRLAPLYDVTCIPLTGYSTNMPFDIGEHRQMDQIDARDILITASDLGVPFQAFDDAVQSIISALESPSVSYSSEVSLMLDRIMDNSKARLAVLKDYLGR